MGLADRLRRLDDRFVPQWAFVQRRNGWTIGLGLVGWAVAAAFLVASQLGGEPPTLGFNCAQPAQPVVEAVLHVHVETSGGVGGSASREATAFWGVGQERVLLVSCTSLDSAELRERTPDVGDAGVVAGQPGFVLGEATSPTFASQINFTYRSALVRIETSEPVDVAGARTLVTSWVDQAKMFSPSSPAS